MTFAGQDGARLGGEVFHAKRCPQNALGFVAQPCRASGSVGVLARLAAPGFVGGMLSCTRCRAVYPHWPANLL